MENIEENSEMIWKISKKSRLNCEIIQKIWKKTQLNSEKILEIPKKIYGKYGRKASQIVIRYEKYGRNKGNNKITELRTILQRESQNS